MSESNGIDLIDLAWQAADSGNFDAARNQIQALLRSTLLNFDQLMRIGECAQTIDANVLATESFYRALIERPKQINACFELAKSLLALGNFEEAGLVIEDIRERSSELACILDAARYFSQKDYENSVRAAYPVLSYFNTGSFADVLSLKSLKKLTSFENKNEEIPKIIFQYWDNNIPEDVFQATRIYADISDFKYVLFDKNDANDFILQYYGSNILKLFHQCYHPAMESDFLRLLYLNVFGGYYFDTDELLIDGRKDFFEFCNKEKFSIFLWQVSKGILANGVIGTVPKHPIIQTSIELVIENLASKKSGGIWSLTGPGVLTRATVAYLYRQNFVFKKSSDISILTDEIIHKYIWHIGFDYEADNRSWQKFELAQS